MQERGWESCVLPLYPLTLPKGESTSDQNEKRMGRE
jgi:hypothetical protein